MLTQVHPQLLWPLPSFPGSHYCFHSIFSIKTAKFLGTAPHVSTILFCKLLSTLATLNNKLHQWLGAVIRHSCFILNWSTGTSRSIQFTLMSRGSAGLSHRLLPDPFLKYQQCQTLSQGFPCMQSRCFNTEPGCFHKHAYKNVCVISL